jgi:hypothetical protein
MPFQPDTDSHEELFSVTPLLTRTVSSDVEPVAIPYYRTDSWVVSSVETCTVDSGVKTTVLFFLNQLLGERSTQELEEL